MRVHMRSIEERGYLLAFLSTKESHRSSSVTCSDESWGCTTIGVVAPLATKRHIILKCLRYSEASGSLPITTMTDECGIGYVSQWL
jgi:hypothetical protein